MSLRAIVIAGLFLCVALPGQAQQSVSIEFSSGQVTLRAQNAPVRTILSEWARLGGSTIVNGDRIAGPPLTLELTGVPERQALDIILHSVAGYMLAPRRAGSTGASAFDRILIMPTSAAPRPTAAVTPAPPGAPRPLLPQPQLIRPQEPIGVPDSDSDAPEEPDQGEVPVPATAPRPLPRVVVPQRPGQPPQPLGPEPQIIRPEDDQPEPEQPPVTPGVAPTPGNPFGIPFGSSGRPGVVTPVPQQQQPARPQQ